MLRFLRTLFLCSPIFFSVFSCKSFEITGVKEISTVQKIVKNQYFSTDSDYVYKTQIEIYKNNLSGILIIKKMGEKHRVVLTSDFGNKLMDFEISEKEFNINYIIPDLDKGIVKTFIENDFRMLLKNQFTVNQEFENENSKIFAAEEAKKKYYLFFNKTNDLLSKIIYTNHGKENVVFGFQAKRPIFADEIEMLHKDFKISIKLFEITENN